ncbi:MAG: hypothetical protein M0D55_03070 [Elusimicrobiota bacterium]|nr:MAG: hypothetical protein M0D55_03070 [Elusimicrobiota bacterium]
MRQDRREPGQKKAEASSGRRHIGADQQGSHHQAQPAMDPDADEGAEKQAVPDLK